MHISIFTTIINSSLITGEHFGEAYGKLNPFRKVPVIDDNGFILTERLGLLQVQTLPVSL